MKRNPIIRFLMQIGQVTEQFSRRNRQHPRGDMGEWVNQGDDWEEDWVWVDSDKAKWLYRICYINIHKREDGHEFIISWERDPDADHVREFAYRHIDETIATWSRYYSQKGKITLIREVEDEKWEGNAWL
ncbi:hypothetical protein M3557_06095 [Bhargavaea ginsengi]|uniref:hypothetical protein n=1 Tax=Bhargavaea ginsengi TaxID=426757 RepID=UPI00203B2DFD|nr:hypothetical protein [Bhargavaea ginsengi]MCM3087482.1 hypothetical protein [Bhargavaea ginsengi]